MTPHFCKTLDPNESIFSSTPTHLHRTNTLGTGACTNRHFATTMNANVVCGLTAKCKRCSTCYITWSNTLSSAITSYCMISLTILALQPVTAHYASSYQVSTRSLGQCTARSSKVGAFKQTLVISLPMPQFLLLCISLTAGTVSDHLAPPPFPPGDYYLLCIPLSQSSLT